MRRSLIPVMAALLLAGGCATEIITYRASAIFPMETGPFYIVDHVAYLTSGAVAMSGYDSDAGENALVVRSFDGGTTRRALPNAGGFAVIPGRAGAFLMLALNEEAVRHVGAATDGQSAGIRYPQAAAGARAGDLGVIGSSTSGDPVLTVFSPTGVRTGPTDITAACAAGCVADQGFALSGSAAVILRSAGAGREIIVTDRTGALLGAPVDTIPATWRFRALSDTTFLVYQPSGVTFNDGHVLMLSSSGTRRSKVDLPALSSATLFFRPHPDGVVIYEAGSNGTLTLATRPWNWSVLGSQGQASDVLAPLPDGSVIYRAGAEVRHTAF